MDEVVPPLKAKSKYHNIHFIRTVTLNLALQVSLSPRFRELLYGIPEHRSGHELIEFPNECFLRHHASFPNLPEHPSHSLMNEVFRVLEKYFSYLQGIGEIPCLDVVEGGHDRDAPLP
jgi:hypothetical protein